jgi:hypothetical protein
VAWNLLGVFATYSPIFARILADHAKIVDPDFRLCGIAVLAILLRPIWIQQTGPNIIGRSPASVTDLQRFKGNNKKSRGFLEIFRVLCLL